MVKNKVKINIAFVMLLIMLALQILSTCCYAKTVSIKIDFDFNGDGLYNTEKLYQYYYDWKPLKSEQSVVSQEELTEDYDGGKVMKVSINNNSLSDSLDNFARGANKEIILEYGNNNYALYDPFLSVQNNRKGILNVKVKITDINGYFKTTGFDFVNFEAGGKIKAGTDQTEIGEWKAGKWYEITALYTADGKCAKGNIYVNGIKVSDEELIFSTADIRVMCLRMKATSASSECLDYCVYVDDFIIKNISDVEYEELKSKILKEVVKPKFYVRLGFDEHDDVKTTGLNSWAKGNEKWGIVKEENGNKLLLLTRTMNDPHIDIDRHLPNEYRINYPDDKQLVLEAKFQFDEIGKTNLFGITSKVPKDGSERKSTTLVMLDNGGNLVSAENEVFGKVNVGERFKMQCLVDFENGTYSVYKDGTKILADAYIGVDDFGLLDSWRIYLWNNARKTIYVDDIAIYAFERVVNVEDYGGFKKEVFAPNETAVNEAKNGCAFKAGGGYAVINGERVGLSEKPYMDEENKKFYIPVSDVENGLAVNLNGVEKNGSYAEISDVAKELNYNYYIDFDSYNNGLAIISKANLDEYKNGEGSVRELKNFLQFSRPSKGEMSELYKSNFAGSHPRLFTNKHNLDEMAKKLQSGGSYEAYGNKIKEQADKDMTKEPCKLVMNGVRINTGTFLPRVKGFIMAYLITKDEKYKQRLFDELKSYGDSANQWAPNHFLSATELTVVYSIAYDWFYDSWSRTERDYICEIIKTRSLDYAYMAAHGIWNYTVEWMKAPESDSEELGNWPVVCEAGQIVGAIATMDEYPDFCLDIIENGLRHIEYSLSEFAPDGGWVEGLSYWGYTLDHFALILSALDYSFGTYFGYSDYEPIKKTMDFEVAMLGSNGIFGFGDANAYNSGEEPQSENMAYFAYAFNDNSWFQYRKQQLNKKNGEYGIFDWLYLPADTAGGKMERSGNDFYFKRLKTGTMFGEENGETFLGYHCGSNLDGHMNYDSGTFVFYSMNVRWAVELGRDNYDISDPYRVRAEGNNVYVINPDKSKGQCVNTPTQNVIKRKYGENTSYAVMDITESYADNAEKALRGIMLTDNRTSAVIRDEISLKRESSLYWFMHIDNDVNVEINGNAAVMTKNGKKVRFEFISNQELNLSVMKAERLSTSGEKENGEMDNAKFKKIVLSGDGLKDDLNITVKLTPEDGKKHSELKDLPLDQWTELDMSCEVLALDKEENNFSLKLKIQSRFYEDLSLFFAAYSGGILKDVEKKDISVSSNEVAFPVLQIEGADSDELRLFVWEKDKTVPKENKYIFNLNREETK